jgi:hypothetical protein
MFKQFIIFFSSIRGYNFSWLPLIVLNRFSNLEIPDDQIQLYYFSLGVLIFILGIILTIFNILLTLLLLYYKDKYNLELKFKNYPRIVRIIKYYQKISYLTIALEVFWILLFASIIFSYSLYMVLIISNNF